MSGITAQTKIAAVELATGAGAIKATDCVLTLTERRKNPANCCRCGESNNNGLRTCDTCREEQRRSNAERRTKPGTLPENRYLDVKGAAAYLGRTTGAIYELKARRKIPVRSDGKRLVFDREELDAYIHGLEGVSVAEAVSRTLNGGTMKRVETPAWREN